MLFSFVMISSSKIFRLST